MTRHVFHNGPCTVVQDETAKPTYEAECASGDIACCEDSGPHRDTQPVDAWMRRHAEHTGHRRYLRIFSGYAVVLEPSAELGESTRANGSTS